MHVMRTSRIIFVAFMSRECDNSEIYFEETHEILFCRNCYVNIKKKKNRNIFVNHEIFILSAHNLNNEKLDEGL